LATPPSLKTPKYRQADQLCRRPLLKCDCCPDFPTRLGQRLVLLQPQVPGDVGSIASHSHLSKWVGRAHRRA
jgi:hypothetical protein